MNNMKIVGIVNNNVMGDGEDEDRIIRLGIETTDVHLIAQAVILDDNAGEFYKDGFMIETVYNCKNNYISDAMEIIYVGEELLKYLRTIGNKEDIEEVKRYIRKNLIDEYNIKFEDAREKKQYSFKRIPQEKLLEYKEIFNSSTLEHEDFEAAVEVLEFGNIDIELNINHSGDINKKNVFSLFVCKNTKTNGWESFRFSNYEFKESDFDSSETLEKIMYEELIKVAKENNLSWSKLN